MEIQIPFKFKPREYQLPFLKAMDSGIKRAVIVWHRRCLLEDTPIAMADGSFLNIQDVSVGDHVLSLENDKLVKRKVLEVYDNGINETLSYNGLYATSNHVVLGKSKWEKISEVTHLTNAGELSFGDVHNPNLAEFLGLMLSDGSITHNQTPKFTNIDLNVLARFKYLCNKLFPNIILKEYKKGKGADLVCTLDKPTGRGQHPLREYFTDSNRMPDIVWQFDRESTLAFLSGVIAGDGCLSYKKSKTPRGKYAFCGSMVIEAGISPKLAEDYRLLLLKFGIRAKVKKDPRGNNTRVFTYSLSTLWKLDGLEICHEKKQEKFLHILQSTRPTRVGMWKEKKCVGDKRIGRTFDLSIEGEHNYIANGYVVHNSGKDKTCFNYMIKKALERKGTYFYFLPTYSQAKKVVWDNIDNDGFKMLEHIPDSLVSNKNATELKIELKNGSVIQLIAADEFSKSGVGTNPVGVVFSEYSINKPEVWDFIRPILKVNGGWAIFNFTPRGTNHAHKLLQIARNEPDWFSEVLTIKETDILTEEDMEAERREGMSEDLIEQEYYCKFVEGAGSYFRNIEACVYAGTPDKVDGSHRYQMGIDLAKYQDFTVITPFDLSTYKVGEIQRFNQLDWGTQKAYIRSASKDYTTTVRPLINLDSTGLGDPIFDDLANDGLNVNSFKFTQQSRRELLDNLRILLDKTKIRIPNNPILIDELKSMRWELTEQGKRKVIVPSGLHDDMIMSLALAVWQIPETPQMPDSNTIRFLSRDKFTSTGSVSLTTYE